MSYLVDGTLPEDETMAKRIHRKSKSYTIMNAEMYKRSVTGVLQRCVEPPEGQEILADIHQGECGHHISTRALVAKAFWHGFYWPTALHDAESIVRKCNGCQRYSNTYASFGSEDDSNHLAICHMVFGHGRSPAASQRQHDSHSRDS